MGPTIRRIGYTLVLLLLAARAALGAGPSPEAVALFNRSDEAYKAGRFAEAAALLRRARALDSSPILDYNLARALEGTGDVNGAISAYEAYLRADPKAADRPRVQSRLAVLRQQLEERQQLITERETIRKEAEHRDRGARRQRIGAAFGVAGLGIVGIVAGGALGGVALARRNDAANAPGQLDASNQLSSAHQLQLGANICFGLGGALALAGGVWGIVELTRRERR
jgi:tetratricopeptide (TPR) repeat protein